MCSNTTLCKLTGFNHYYSLSKIVVTEFGQPRLILLHSSVQPLDPILPIVGRNPTNSLSCHPMSNKTYWTSLQLTTNFHSSNFSRLVDPLINQSNFYTHRFFPWALLTDASLNVFQPLITYLLDLGYFLWFFLYVSLSLSYSYLI